VDLIGKGGHIRMVPIPHWAKQALEKCLRSPRARRDGKTRRNAAPNRRVRGFGTLRDTKTDSGPATGINQLIHFKRDMLVGPAGIEPATLGLEIRCSIRLSYGPSNILVSELGALTSLPPPSPEQPPLEKR
jgi:hypothetical protein